MKHIKTRDGLDILVDNEDYEALIKNMWCKLGPVYAGYRVSSNGICKRVWMHRFIWESHNGNIPKGYEIDHVDGNPLNNRLENLRLATRTQNNINSCKRKNCSCKYKGVSWNKYHKKWEAYINIDKKRIKLGYFTSQYKAARAYDEKAVEVYGEFARVNLPRINK